MSSVAATSSGSGHRIALTICVMTATVMQALDSTIANVALPYMQGSLAATSTEVNWVLTSYIVAAAIVTPASGWRPDLAGVGCSSSASSASSSPPC